MTSAKLTEWRKAFGHTQETLAEALGCSRRALGNWESGVYPVPRYIALALAAIARKLKPIGE